jgi:hypothetical protein
MPKLDVSSSRPDWVVLLFWLSFLFIIVPLELWGIYRLLNHFDLVNPIVEIFSYKKPTLCG